MKRLLHLTLLMLIGVWCLPPAGAAERVFTIFCHGTGSHRSSRDLELIAELGAAYWNRGRTESPNAFYKAHYQQDFLILDGVGTSDSYTTELGPKVVGLATSLKPAAGEKWAHAMPGDFKPDSLDKPHKQKKWKQPRGSQKNWDQRVSEMAYPSTPGKNYGDIMGVGWDDNVAHALFVLEELRKKGKFPTVINMIGWSRGAVTCIKLSNAIDDYFVRKQPYMRLPDAKKGSGTAVQFYPAISGNVTAPKLNLFLVDPVPGRFGATGTELGGKRSTETFSDLPFERDYRKLPAIVKNCIVTLALDEQREGFAALDDPKDLAVNRTKTNFVWLPFPGIHRTQVRLEPRDPPGTPAIRKKLTSVPRVVWDLSWRFLTAHGTKFQRSGISNGAFNGKQLMTSEDLVDVYADIWLLRSEYHQTRNRGVMQRIAGGLKPRIFTGYPFAGREYSGKNPIQSKRKREDLFTSQLGFYVQSPGFFINEHHRACFEKAHPQLYKFFMNKPRSSVSVTVGGKKSSAYPAPVNVLKTEAGSTLARQLAQLGMFQAGGKTYAPADFGFGARLGEKLRKGAVPAKAYFTGKELTAMKVIGK